MFFTKYPHPANFAFVESYDSEKRRATFGVRSCSLNCQSYEGGYFHFLARDEETWKPDPCIVPLEIPSQVRFNHVCIAENFDVSLLADSGRTIAELTPGKGFGISGEASIFQFEVPEDALFFGMGEKCFGRLELSGIRTKFWSTDVWSDFHWGQWGEHPVDPPYFSLPYLAVRMNGCWVGFLLHNPGVTFMQTPGKDESRVFVEWQKTSRQLILGSENGEPSLWVFHADTLSELTQKLQKLVGVTPTPPMWSLGFHQSRWGYGGHDDLLELDRKFEKYEIPCSGLWLDLDYMDGFRVFKTDEKQFPKGANFTSDILKKNSRRIVPIIDPGIKQEEGYSVYDEGRSLGIFCRNKIGREYVGLVWPGETVFPDFTLKEARDWWTGKSKEFRESGFGAAWVDMNDPSTGPVDPTDMLFNHGKEAHALNRNQYALGMQMATFDGFLAAVPNERPFLLSRSGFIGTSKVSAVWTGDNLSNEHYLKQALPTTMGLAISGLPFNGPDLGGFGGDASDELMIRWFQACMLFPFYRNHSTQDSRLEEPWRYSTKTRKILAHFIRLRYQFLPYLYQLFIQQEMTGDAIVRPLIYDFDDVELANVDHQLMIGSQLMQAPIVELSKEHREVIFPGNEPWFDLCHGGWTSAGKHKLRAKVAQTPLFARNGAIVALQNELPIGNSVDLKRPTFFLFLAEDLEVSNRIEYFADDGISYDYRNGARSSCSVQVSSTRNNISIEFKLGERGFGEIVPTFAMIPTDRKITLNGKPVKATQKEYKLAGSSLSFLTF